jgi:hypothetical protein
MNAVRLQAIHSTPHFLEKVMPVILFLRDHKIFTFLEKALRLYLFLEKEVLTPDELQVILDESCRPEAFFLVLSKVFFYR